MEKRIVRVFPRKTNATLDDTLAFVSRAPPHDLEDVEEVHVSATFTYDIPTAEGLGPGNVARWACRFWWKAPRMARRAARLCRACI